MKASRNGEFSFKFSSDIKTPNFVEMLKSFIKDKRKGRILQAVEDKQKKKPGTGISEEQLGALTQLIKMSESMQAELIPGDELGLDKKQFNWSVTEYSK